MNRGLIVVLALAAILVVVVADEQYTDKYDNVNLDEILSNERLFKKYLECLLADNENHCTPDGKELRRNIPDALTTKCSKCTEKQKQGTEKVINYLRQNKPDDFEKLEDKWDPEGVYRKKYADATATSA